MAAAVHPGLAYELVPDDDDAEKLVEQQDEEKQLQTHPSQVQLRDDQLPASPSPHSHPSHVSLPWIYCLCIANFGLSGAWALEFAITTPYFEKGLKAGAVVSHAVWVVGPLSGLIVAPIVGALSDRCTHPKGRRRPFIVAGLIATVIGMLMFSNALAIAAIPFSPDTEAHRILAIAVAIVAFCVMDLAINTTMWPIRALQGDLVHTSQQHLLQSASIVLGSFGDLTANALIRSFDQPVRHIRSSYAVVAIIYSVAIGSLLVLGEEKQHLPGDVTASRDSASSLNIFQYLRGLPPWLTRIGGTYALGFFALFCCMPNAANWLGSSVLNGNPEAPENSEAVQAYERGVKISGQAGLLRAALQIAFSASYPWLVEERKVISEGQLMGVCYAIFGVLVAIFSNTSSAMVARIVVIMMALPMAAHFTLPIGMTVQKSDEDNRGRHLGALNCFAVIPQLIDTTYTGFVSRAWGEAAVMQIGAAWAILTAISAFLYMKP